MYAQQWPQVGPMQLGGLIQRRRLVFRLACNLLGARVFGFCRRQTFSTLSSRTFQYSQARATGPGRKLYSPASRVSAGFSGETWPSVCA